CFSILALLTGLVALTALFETENQLFPVQRSLIPINALRTKFTEECGTIRGTSGIFRSSSKSSDEIIPITVAGWDHLGTLVALGYRDKGHAVALVTQAARHNPPGLSKCFCFFLCAMTFINTMTRLNVFAARAAPGYKRVDARIAVASGSLELLLFGCRPLRIT
ncbi:unnamed protein product, partial [Bathycoccus prasinos]